MTENIPSEYIEFSTGHLDFFVPKYDYENLGEWIGCLIANPNTHTRTIVKGMKILSLSSVTLLQPGVGEVSSIPSIYIDEHPLEYIKQTKKLIKEMCIEHYKCHRIQAAIWKDDPVSINWIEKLGFRFEGVMKDWHPGQDHYLYSKVDKWQPEQ